MGAEKSFVSEILQKTLMDVLEKGISEIVLSETASLKVESEGKENDLSASVRELAEKDAEIATLAQERDALKSMVAKVQGSLAEAQCQTESANSQIANLTARISTKTNEYAALHERLEASDKALSEIQTLQFRIAEQDRRITELDGQNKLLKRDSDDLRSLQRELPLLQSKADRFDDLMQRCTGMEVQITELTEKLQKLSEKLAVANVEATEARVIANAAETVKSALQRQIDELLADKKVLMEEMRQNKLELRKKELSSDKKHSVAPVSQGKVENKQVRIRVLDNNK